MRKRGDTWLRWVSRDSRCVYASQLVAREREREFKEQVIVATYYLSAVSLNLFSRTRLESVRTRKEENTRLGMVEIGRKRKRERRKRVTPELSLISTLVNIGSTICERERLLSRNLFVCTVVTAYPAVSLDTERYTGSRGRVKETNGKETRHPGLVTLVKGCLTFFRAGLSRSVHTWMG